MKSFVGKCLPVVLVSAMGVAGMHAQSTYGTITGVVTDSQGAAIPGATITIVNTNNGITKTLKSRGAGEFTFPTLEPGTYSVKAEASGFQLQEVAKAVVNVASSLTVNFAMKSGAVTEVVQVLANDELLEKTTAELGTTVQEKQLQDLPTNGRDYGRFALQTPGSLASSKSIASLSFNGQQVIQNAFTIDGVDATRVDEPYMANGNERGARLLTGSLETLSEFKIQTSGADAQYGRAAAASMNIVTKSGGNKFHGTVYDYFRNDALDARNYFAKATGTSAVRKPEFRFNDFGGAIGGPVRKDKTFFFLNYEGDRQILGTTSTGTIPSATLRAAVLAKSPVLAPILDLMPTGGTPSGDAAGYVNNLTVVRNSTINEDTGSARIDHHIGSHDTLFGRININNSVSGGSRNSVTASAFGPGDFQYVPIRITNLAIHEQHTAGSFYNDALFGMQRVATTLASDNGQPSTSVTGLTISVGNTVVSYNVSSLFQGSDNMTLVHGKHTFMWGGSYYHIGVQYSSTASLSMSYSSIQNFINNQLNTISVAGVDPGHNTIGHQFGAFAQDTWKLRSNLTVNLGMRWDFEPPIHDANNVTQPFDPRINALAPTGTSYYDSHPKNFAPRIGIAYSPNERTVLRASYGLFYILQPVGNAVYSLPLNNIKGTISLSSTTTPGISYPLTPWIAAATGTNNTGYGFLRRLPEQYAQQYNASVQQQLSPSTTFTMAFVGVHGVHLERYENINLKNVTLGARPLAGFGDVFLQGMTGMNLYDALQMTFLHRVGKGLTAQANYSWSHGIDDVSDGSNSTGTAPQNLANLRAERGTASSDVRNNFSGNIVWELPMGKGHSLLGHAPAALSVLSSGWQVNGSSIIRSGVAVNVTTSVNTSGDGNVTNQRPNINYGINPYLGKGITGFLNPAAWSAAAPGTFGNSPRNPVHGIGFTQLDTSLMKNTPLGEDRNLQFRAEFFNIFNHPIFGTPGGNITNTTFGTITSTYGGTVGLGTPRQIEFAIKYQF